MIPHPTRAHLRAGAVIASTRPKDPDESFVLVMEIPGRDEWLLKSRMGSMAHILSATFILEHCQVLEPAP